MRNNSEGRELPPLPYPQIPGLEVSEPATPYQQLVAHLDFQAAVRQVPSRPVVQPSPAGRQRGSATLALIVLVCVAAIGAVLYYGPKQDARLADEIKSCIDAGGEPIVRGAAVRCAIRPMVRS